MLVTDQSDRKSFREAAILSAMFCIAGLGFAFLSPFGIALILIAPLVFWFWRRENHRRRRVTQQPLDEKISNVLQSRVRFYRALSEDQKDRFNKMVQVFLDEVTITGIRTDVDETTRALVAASAVIPIFGFDDWEYSGLGEVLIYPGAYNENYQTDGGGDRNILGMIGVGHLSGVMILSKPDLIQGFEIDTDKRNVGIHEFAHLVDKADGDVDGLPATNPADTVAPWIKWVGEELRRDGTDQTHIDDYAYTNEAEYFAVLSEYFFESPARLQKKNPKLYSMMQKMYHQNTQRHFQRRPKRRRRVGRNDDCPCGSGEKFKRCCRRS